MFSESVTVLIVLYLSLGCCFYEETVITQIGQHMIPYTIHFFNEVGQYV